MEPWLLPNDKQLYYQYLDKASFYFEYGSGGSTLQAHSRKNITQIFSVESDKAWYKKVADMLKDASHIQLILNDLNCEPNTWGNPGSKCSNEQKKRVFKPYLLIKY
jgi:hypothetical protein